MLVFPLVGVMNLVLLESASFSLRASILGISVPSRHFVVPRDWEYSVYTKWSAQPERTDTKFASNDAIGLQRSFRLKFTNQKAHISEPNFQFLWNQGKRFNFIGAWGGPVPPPKQAVASKPLYSSWCWILPTDKPNYDDHLSVEPFPISFSWAAKANGVFLDEAQAGPKWKSSQVSV